MIVCKDLYVVCPDSGAGYHWIPPTRKWWQRTSCCLAYVSNSISILPININISKMADKMNGDYYIATWVMESPTIIRVYGSSLPLPCLLKVKESGGKGKRKWRKKHCGLSGSILSPSFPLLWNNHEREPQEEQEKNGDNNDQEEISPLAKEVG